jgi:hypothetical protein
LFSAVWVAEVALGLWLISGSSRIQAGLYGILAFVALGTVSCRMALAGAGDCGCMGPFPTNPWAMVVIDALMAVGLAFTFFSGSDRLALANGLRQFAVSASIIALAIAVTTSAILGRYGSINSAVRTWRGYPLDLPSAVEGVAGVDDGISRVTIPVRNISDGTVRLIGTDACCGTKVLTALPRSLGPGDEGSLELTVSRGRQPFRILTVWVESSGRLTKQRVIVSCRKRDD